MDAVDALSLGVVGLEVGIGEWPRGRGALLMLDGTEIGLAEPGQARAVDLRVAADHVVHAGRERAPGAIEPTLVRLVPALGEHRLRGPVLRLAREPLPTLEHKDVRAPLGEREGGRAAAHAGSDDHDVAVQVRHRFLTLVRAPGTVKRGYVRPS